MNPEFPSALSSLEAQAPINEDTNSPENKEYELEEFRYGYQITVTNKDTAKKIVTDFWQTLKPQGERISTGMWDPIEDVISLGDRTSVDITYENPPKYIVHIMGNQQPLSPEGADWVKENFLQSNL